MKLTFHGACNEVGRSCVELETSKKTRVLLDAGIEFDEHGTKYPEKVTDLAGFKGVFLCHAHLDHSGALPLFDHQGMQCPIYCTPATKGITRILLEDAFKIGKLKHEHLNYTEQDIQKALQFTRRAKLLEEGIIDDLEFEFFDSGHIPGSASVLLEADDKRLVYTSDISVSDTRLLKGADTDYGHVDVMITEATYGDRDHAPRDKTEKEFLDKIKEITDNGHSVIIPVFAVGRAQEILLVLQQMKWKVPIYLDGMAKEATELILNYPDSLRDEKALRKAFSNVEYVKGDIQRAKFVRQPGIFVTTSGMLTGGPVMNYIKHMFAEKGNGILLTGFQGKGTNGRLLMEHGEVYVDGWKHNVKCFYKNHDFSAHAGQSELRKLIKKTSPQTVVINHGDPEAIEALAEWASALGFKVHVPELGRVINL
jgi:putative mRNA 3-end processing factor